MSSITVAAIQMRSGQDPSANIAELRRAVAEAVAAGAVYVQTPEMTGALCRDRQALRAMLREEADDPVAQAAAALARENAIHLHIGSTAIALPDGKVANRGLLYGPDGMRIASYDKIHMFDVDLDKGESWRESATYAPGVVSPVVALPFGRLGMAICYDLRFPQLFRAQARAHADILTVPAAFTRQTGEAHWLPLLRARAIENGAFVIAAAQGGRHEDGRETYGHSMIVDPWGQVLAAADHADPAIIYARIDVEAVVAARRKVPNLRNAREFKVQTIDPGEASPAGTPS